MGKGFIVLGSSAVYSCGSVDICDLEFVGFSNVREEADKLAKKKMKAYIKNEATEASQQTKEDYDRVRKSLKKCIFHNIDKSTISLESNDLCNVDFDLYEKYGDIRVIYRVDIKEVDCNVQFTDKDSPEDANSYEELKSYIS